MGHFEKSLASDRCLKFNVLISPSESNSPTTSSCLTKGLSSWSSPTVSNVDWSVKLSRGSNRRDLSSKQFFGGLVKYMASGPVVPMVWQGTGVVKTGRVMLGETNPKDSRPGTIRGDYCVEIGRNVCHGSDSVESAQKEINLWFKPEELTSYVPCGHPWVYE